MPDDDHTISGETRLYRRLHPDQVVWDGNEGRIRASSGAFKDERLSVHLGNELERINEPPEFALRNLPRHSLGWLTVAFVESEEQVVESTPTEDDPTHGEVVGNKPGARRNVFARTIEIDIIRREFLRPEVREQLPDQAA